MLVIGLSCFQNMVWGNTELIYRFDNNFQEEKDYINYNVTFDKVKEVLKNGYINSLISSDVIVENLTEKHVAVRRVILLDGRILPCLIDNQGQGTQDDSQLAGNSVNAVGLAPKKMKHDKTPGKRQYPPTDNARQQRQRVAQQLPTDQGRFNLGYDIAAEYGHFVLKPHQYGHPGDDERPEYAMHAPMQHGHQKDAEKPRKQRAEYARIDVISVAVKPTVNLDMDFVDRYYQQHTYHLREILEGIKQVYHTGKQDAYQQISKNDAVGIGYYLSTLTGIAGFEQQTENTVPEIECQNRNQEEDEAKIDVVSTKILGSYVIGIERNQEEGYRIRTNGPYAINQDIDQKILFFTPLWHVLFL